MKEIGVGVIGVGTVGGGVVKVLQNRKNVFAASGIPCRLVHIADRATERFTELPTDGVLCSADAKEVLNDPAVHIVVELVGGTTFARQLVLDALSCGVPEEGTPHKNGRRLIEQGELNAFIFRRAAKFRADKLFRGGKNYKIKEQSSD